MSWSGFFRFLFAPPGTPSYEFGYAVGKALRKMIDRRDSSGPDDESRRETPEDAFRKLVEDNEDAFDDADPPKEEGG
jgi:hypothetical protein